MTLLLSATEMDGDVITVKLTSSNLEDQMAVYLTEADWTATEAGRIDATVSSRAAPGAEMDLVDAPNATAVAAIQSGLAPANEYDTQLDVAVSSRSTPRRVGLDAARAHGRNGGMT